MKYIQRQGKSLRTIKQCETEAELKTALKKLRQRQDATYYPSTRPCKGWKANH